MLSEYTREELASGMDRVVDEVLGTAGVEGPPVDAFTVARSLDIVIALDDRQQGRARYVRRCDRRLRRSRPTILLRPEPRWERQQWAIAHEIGEHVACRIFAQWGVDPRETPPNAREVVANNVAGRLLLPSEWFASDAAALGWDLFGLKSRYGTASHELIARRMLELRPTVIISVFDHGCISWRRSNLPGRVPGPSEAELECWRGSTTTIGRSKAAKGRRGSVVGPFTRTAGNAKSSAPRSMRARWSSASSCPRQDGL